MIESLQNNCHAALNHKRRGHLPEKIVSSRLGIRSG
jgi:hypothetical protein